MAQQQWNPTRVSFNDANQMMQGASQSYQNASDYFTKLGDNILAEERQKVADAQNKLLFDQQQEDRAQAKQIRANTLLADTYSSLAEGATKSEVAAASPEWKDAIGWAEKQDRFNKLNDEGNSVLSGYTPEAILAEYQKTLTAPAQASYTPVLGGTDADVASVQSSATTSVTPRAGKATNVVTGYKDVEKVIPGHVVDPDATVKYNVSTQKTLPKPYSVIDAIFGGDGRVEREDSSVLRNKVTQIEKKYDKLLEPHQAVMRNRAGMGIGREVFDTAAKNAEALIAKRDAELYQARTKEAPGGGTTTVLKPRESKISDFDMSKVYDSTGKVITSGAQAPKNGQVYMKDKTTGELLNTTTLGKAVQSNWADSKVEVVQKPVYGKAAAPSIAEIASGAPVFKTTEAKVSAMAKTSGVKPEEITTGLQGMGNQYASVLGMLGKDNTAERDALRRNMQTIAGGLGLTSQDYDIDKRLNSILPTNDLTQRQMQGINLAIKELDNVREDRKWQAEMNFKAKEAMWNHAMDKANLHLKQVGLAQDASQHAATLAAGKSGVLPPGHTVVMDPKTGEQKVVLLSTEASAQKEALDAKTPKGQREERAASNKEFDDYKLRHSSGWYNPFGESPKYTDKTAWEKAGRPY